MAIPMPIMASVLHNLKRAHRPWIYISVDIIDQLSALATDK